MKFRLLTTCFVFCFTFQGFAFDKSPPAANDFYAQLDTCLVLQQAFGPDTLCIDQPENFYAEATGQGATYSWNFGNAANPTTASGGGPHNVSFNTAGLQQVLLTTNQGGCTRIDTFEVEVVEGVQPAYINGAFLVCEGNLRTFSTQDQGAGTTYFWDFGADAVPTSSTERSPEVYFKGAAIHTVSLTVTKNGCSFVGEREVESKAAYTFLSYVEPHSINIGESVLLTGKNWAADEYYSWTPSTGLSSPYSNQTYASPAESTYYYFNVSNGACSGSRTFYVGVIGETDAGEDKFICSGDSIQIGGAPTSGAGPNAVVEWTPAINISDPAAENPWVSPTVNTTYTVCVTPAGGQSSCDEVTVNVLPAVVVDAGSDLTICGGDTVVIGGPGSNPFASYIWSPSTGLTSPDAASTLCFPTATTTYTLEATRFGCTARDSVVVSVIPCNFLKNDSLELVKIYNQTDGQNWANPWDLNTRLSTWPGLGLTANGRAVEELDLSMNNLQGSFPDIFLNDLKVLDLSSNELDEVADFSNLNGLQTLDLSDNKLIAVPDLAALNNLNDLSIQNNRLDFSAIAAIPPINSFNYVPQDSLELKNMDANTLAFSVEGNLANNTYRWYKDNALQGMFTADSTFSITGQGLYRCEATNSQFPDLSLTSRSLNICGTTLNENTIFLQDITNETTPYCPGQTLVFKANDYTATSATNVYSFYVNENLAQNGAQDIFTSNDISNGDEVSLLVESADGCQFYSGNPIPGVAATVSIDFRPEPQVAICRNSSTQFEVNLIQGIAPWQFDLQEKMADGTTLLTNYSLNNPSTTIPVNTNSTYEIINIQDENCGNENAVQIPKIEGCSRICVGSNTVQVEEFTAHFFKAGTVNWEILPSNVLSNDDFRLVGGMNDAVLRLDFFNPSPSVAQITLRATAETDCGTGLVEFQVILDQNCVWPGDVNMDGSMVASGDPWVDDAIGLYFAIEEYEAYSNNVNNIDLHSYQRNPGSQATKNYEWAPQSARDWLLEDAAGNQGPANFDMKDENGNVIRTLNLKYADSNGNSEIDEGAAWNSMNENFDSIPYRSDYDIIAYHAMLGNTHNGNSAAKQANYQDLLHISVADSVYNNGDEVVFNVSLGDASNIVEDVVNVTFWAEGEFGTYGSPSVAMAGVSHLSYKPSDKADYPVNLVNWAGETGDSLNWYLTINSEDDIPKTFAGEPVCNAICHVTVVGLGNNIASQKSPVDSLGIPVSFKIPAAAIAFSDGSVRYAQSNEVTLYLKPDPELAARLLLEGAYDTNTGLMRDDLRIRNLIPAHEPYSSMSSYDFPRENVVGIGMTDSLEVLSASGQDALVDWVFIEVRAASDSSLVSSRPALLQRDGDVVDVDGFSAVPLPQVAYGEYFLVLRHRNHLPVMTENPVNLQRGITTLDFTGAPANRQKEILPNIYGLYAGDATCEDTNCESGYDINGEDRIYWSHKNGWNPVYEEADFDMNADVNGVDKVLWLENMGVNLNLPR